MELSESVKGSWSSRGQQTLSKHELLLPPCGSLLIETQQLEE